MEIPKLETGMLVKLADDTIAIVIENVVRGRSVPDNEVTRSVFALVDSRGDAIYSDGYSPDLTHKRHSSGDIVEIRGGSIFNPRSILYLMENKFDQLPLLWKRETAKKMTIEEIEKILGYKVDIVN